MNDRPTSAAGMPEQLPSGFPVVEPGLPLGLEGLEDFPLDPDLDPVHAEDQRVRHLSHQGPTEI